MTTSSIAATASAARQRLASSLAALQQDPNIPAGILDVVSGLARAMGPLFQVERGTGDPTLLFTARAVLQETLGRMQTCDQSYPGVADATAAIAQSLGMLFAAIRENNLVDPGVASAAATSQPATVIVAPQTPPPPQPTPPLYVVSPAPEPYLPPAAPYVPPAAPYVPPAAPVPLVQHMAAPVPLVQHVAAPVPLVQTANIAAPISNRAPGAPRGAPNIPSLIPDTAAKVPMGANGLPRLEAELDVHSDSNFYTNFLGDIRDHGGIFVATFGALSVSTRCEVVISLPGALTAEVQGVVRWKREVNGETGQIPGLGVEITHGSADAWKLIDRFIKNREPIVHEV